MNKLKLLILASLQIVFSLGVNALDLKLEGDQSFIQDWKVTAKPYWLEKDTEGYLFLETVISWRGDQKPQIIDYDKDSPQVEPSEPIRIDNGSARVLVSRKKTVLNFTLKNGTTLPVTLTMSPLKAPILVHRNCRKYGLNPKISNPVLSGYYAGLYCSVKNDILVMTLSTSQDGNVETTLFETKGKGELNKVFEIPMSLGMIAKKGSLGEIKWGRDEEINSIDTQSLGSGHISQKPADESAKSTPKYVGISFNSVSVGNENPTTSSETAVTLEAGLSSKFGTSRYGLVADLSFLIYESNAAAKINYTSLLVGPAAWFNKNTTSFGFFVAGKWLSIGSGQIGSGASSQSPALGITIDGAWFSKNKTHLLLATSSISQASITGTCTDFRLRKDLMFRSHPYYLGLNYSTLNMKQPPDSKLSMTLTGLAVGLNF